MGITAHVEATFFVVDGGGTKLSTPRLFETADRLTDELLKLEQCAGNEHIMDSTVSADAESGTVTVELYVTGDDDTHVIGDSVAFIRTAVHATDGSTADWDRGGNHSRDVEFQRKSMALQVG